MKKHNLRKQSKLLVESILDKDPIRANSIFQQLVMEAEEEREDDVLAELGLDEENPDSDTTETTEEPIEGIDDSFDTGVADDIESMNADEADKTVDDIIEINCQINAKLISNLFDKIAELKTQVEGLGLDESSREYLKYDVTIQYYSDKLQDLQNKTNPGIDQGKVQTAIEKIESAIQELAGEIDGGSDDFAVDSPNEVEAEAGLGESEQTDTIEAETDGEENTDSESEDVTDAEDDADVDNETDSEETDISSEDDLEELFS